MPERPNRQNAPHFPNTLPSRLTAFAAQARPAWLSLGFLLILLPGVALVPAAAGAAQQKPDPTAESLTDAPSANTEHADDLDDGEGDGDDGSSRLGQDDPTAKRYPAELRPVSPEEERALLGDWGDSDDGED